MTLPPGGDWRVEWSPGGWGGPAVPTGGGKWAGRREVRSPALRAWTGGGGGAGSVPPRASPPQRARAPERRRRRRQQHWPHRQHQHSQQPRAASGGAGPTDRRTEGPGRARPAQAGHGGRLVRRGARGGSPGPCELRAAAPDPAAGRILGEWPAPAPAPIPPPTSPRQPHPDHLCLAPALRPFPIHAGPSPAGRRLG